MRLTSAVFVAASAVSLALTAAAQTEPPAPKLEPLPEAAPPPPEIANPELTPDITTVKHENETIEEYRVHGKLTMVKVTPRHGHSYYLIADATNGGFVRRDSLDTGLRVPLWVLFSF